MGLSSVEKNESVESGQEEGLAKAGGQGGASLRW